MTTLHERQLATTAPRAPLPRTAAFLAVATALCLAVASPIVLGDGGDDLAAMLVPAAQLTPFLTALIFLRLLRGGRFVDAFALRWGGSWRAIGLGLAVVVGIGLVQLGIGLASGDELSASGAIAPAAAAVLPLLVLQCVFAIGEELGWRGWLVTQWRDRPFVQVAAVSAVAWVVWHLPALPLIVGDAGWQEGAAYLLAIASWAPFLVALRLASGSVWPAVIVHGALNSIRVFLTQSVASGDGVSWPVEAAGWVLWLAAAALLARRVARTR